MPVYKYDTDEQRRIAHINNVKAYKQRMRDKLIEVNGTPKRGRPIKYNSEEERIEAKKAQVCKCSINYYYRKKETQNHIVLQEV
jgi:spore germination protein GerM